MQKTKDQQDYEAAFNDEEVPTADAPEGDSGAEVPAVTLTEGAGQAVPVGDSEQTDGAAPNEPTEEADAVETPEDAQRRKSWEGRLKKMEAELKAREDALAARETQPAALADGGEVDLPTKDSGEPAVMDADSIDAIKSEAMELASSRKKLIGVLRTMIEDYGREFVVGVVALAAPLIDAKAESYVNDFNGNLESLVSEIQQAFSGMHRASIADAHEDFEQVVESDEFKAWMDGLDEAAKAKAEQVVDSGSAGQVVKLLGQFKDSLKPKEKTADDIWAEDAATSVRSSAPLKIQSRAPMSDSDEYKRAFDEA
jgi:Meckel syndrome type 1 protein